MKLNRNRTLAERHWCSYLPEYRVWVSMIARCHNPKNKSYPNYGGRGITVCKRWHILENFLTDMGKRPSGKQLDRIDNSGNYEPSNCRWATRRQQQNNTRKNALVTYKGVTLTVSQWSRRVSIDAPILWNRIYLYGWSIRKALYTPVKRRGVLH